MKLFAHDSDSHWLAHFAELQVFAPPISVAADGGFGQTHRF